MANEKLDWAEFEVESLPAKLKALFEEAKMCYKAAGDAQETLRKAMEKHMVETKKLDGASQRLVMTMRFGKLSVAKAEAEKPKASSKPKLKW